MLKFYWKSSFPDTKLIKEKNLEYTISRKQKSLDSFQFEENNTSIYLFSLNSKIKLLNVLLKGEILLSLSIFLSY